jgi:hypothetical protein
MNTKALTAVIILTATAIALNPIKIPTIFWPGQYYRLWEIPLIVAFFLFGLRLALLATTLYATAHVTILSALVGPIAFPWVIILMLSTFLGLSIFLNLSNRKFTKKENTSKKSFFYCIFFGTLTRVAIMPFVDLAMYKFLLPIFVGNSFSDTYILGLIPAIVFFNITVPLYSIPIAYITAKTINKNLRVGNFIKF